MPRFSIEENRQHHNSLPCKPMAAGVVFKDETGRILLVKPNYRDFWIVPGGTADDGEAPLACAIREVKEELGLKIEPGQLTFRLVDYRPPYDGFNDKLYFYFDGGVLSPEQIGRIKLQADELDEYRFVTLDEAMELSSDWTACQISFAVRQGGPFYLEGGRQVQ